VVCRGRGTQQRWMQSSGDTVSPDDITGPPQWQPRHGRKQTRECTGRQMPQHFVASANADAITDMTGCQHDYGPSAVGRAEGGAGGQKKGRNFHKKSSKIKASTPPHTSGIAVCPGVESPAMPQTSSLSHQLPQSMHHCSSV